MQASNAYFMHFFALSIIFRPNDPKDFQKMLAFEIVISLVQSLLSILKKSLGKIRELEGISSSLKKRDDSKENTKSKISDYYQPNMLIMPKFPKICTLKESLYNLYLKEFLGFWLYLADVFLAVEKDENTIKT